MKGIVAIWGEDLTFKYWDTPLRSELNKFRIAHFKKSFTEREHPAQTYSTSSHTVSEQIFLCQL
jgi:hypothetical protein